MKCRECPDYKKCVKESNLAIKRKNCPKAKTEKAKTNADRVRNWNDHELAETIANFGSEIDNGDVRYSDDPNDWLKWLQQIAE